mgnify:CR=1 FL=1
MTAKSATPNRHNNINKPPLLWAVFYGNMEREFFDEYCSLELLALITGYVCPKYQMKSLNEFGIPFLHPKGNRKFPLVLRSDGDKILKGEKVQPIIQTKEIRRSAVLS